jgi:aryl-alcohol dehydrogenase-like predicted oxidoreductase
VTRDRIGIGLAAVARPAYITAGRARDLGERRGVDDLRARTWAVLDAAVDAGVGYVDVARSYGRAEEFLAGWLAARPGVRVSVGSKWGYRYVGGWRTDAETHEVKDHSREAFQQQRDETLALLGGRLDVYHVHSATLETGVLDDRRLHEELAALRDGGVAVGISTSGPVQAAAVRQALEVEVGGAPLFTSFQATWNVLETSVAPALEEAAQAGATVIVKEPVANGRLVPGSEDPAPGVRRVAALAAELGIGEDVLALAAALAQPSTTRVLSGAVTPEQVRSNASAADVTLPPDVLDQLGELAEDPADYWAARSRRSWT